MSRIESDRSGIIRDANELSGEQVRSRLIEPPVRQGDARVDLLQLSLQIQQVGPVPGEEAREIVCFVLGFFSVHGAEGTEPAVAPTVEDSESGQEAVPLILRQFVSVL